MFESMRVYLIIYAWESRWDMHGFGIFICQTFKAFYVIHFSVRTHISEKNEKRVLIIHFIRFLSIAAACYFSSDSLSVRNTCEPP